MATGYIGVSNTSKKLKAIYIGVNGVAKKVTKVYGGVSGVAKLLWTGEKTKVAIPSVSGSYTYTRASASTAATYSASITGYDSAVMTQSGTTSTSNAGTYTVTFSLKDKNSYQWSDGTTDDKTGTWSIAKRSLAIPTLSGSYTYTGSSQNVTINNYNSYYESQTGNASGTNAGTYYVYFSLLDTANTYWVGGSTSQQTKSWAISKAQVGITVSPSSMSLTRGGATKSVTITLTGATILPYYLDVYSDNIGPIRATSSKGQSDYSSAVSVINDTMISRSSHQTGTGYLVLVTNCGGSSFRGQWDVDSNHEISTATYTDATSAFNRYTTTPNSVTILQSTASSGEYIVYITTDCKVTVS